MSLQGRFVQIHLSKSFSWTMSMNYEPYWTTGDFSADLQALAPVKFDLSISLIRNSRRTVIATVLQPTYLAIQSMTLLEGNKSRLKRCNPTGKVVLQCFTSIFFSVSFQGCKQCKHWTFEFWISKNASSAIFYCLMLCALCLSCEEEAHTDAVTEKTDAPVDKEATLDYVYHITWMICGGYNHPGKRTTYGIGTFFE